MLRKSCFCCFIYSCLCLFTQLLVILHCRAGKHHTLNLIWVFICHQDEFFEHMPTWDKYARCSLVLQYSWYIFCNLRYSCFLASMCELAYKDMSNCFNENFTSAPFSSHFIVNAIRSAIAFFPVSLQIRHGKMISFIIILLLKYDSKAPMNLISLMFSLNWNSLNHKVSYNVFFIKMLTIFKNGCFWTSFIWVLTTYGYIRDLVFQLTWS